MEQQKRARSNSGSNSSGKQKKAHIEPIILNYGIEIEAVFELINEYNAYNQFIKFYLNNITNNDKINTTMRDFIKILKLCIENTDDDNDNQIILKNEIKENNIYIELIKTEKIKTKNKRIIEEEEEEADFLSGLGNSVVYKTIEEEIEIEKDNIDNFLGTNLNKLIDEAKRPINVKNESITDEIKNFINDWYNFLNIAIIIIKYKLDNILSVKDRIVIYSLLNIMSPEENILENFKNIFELNNSIKLYNSIDEDINKFYQEEIKENEIILLLTKDLSVICNDNKVYKDIISGKIVKYNYLLNNCEFITQPFKDIKDIEKKLSIFFNEPIINKTLLNCITTSQHVHISLNNSKGIIKPDIYLILTIVCICNYFQDKIFKLFLITRTNNNYCKKLNYNNTLEEENYIFNNNTNFYNNNIIRILSIFYEKFDNISDYYFNRYYWFNILNLYKLSDNSPYTIEFRLKHGSTDVLELCNVCKLYENIINYAINLLNSNTNLREIKDIRIFKETIDSLIRPNETNIFNNEILFNIKDYFTDSTSNYIIGLNKLNSELSQSIEGGKSQKSKISKIDNFIKTLNNKPIYKMNSFGYEFIGYGLNDIIREKLKLNFEFKSKSKVFDIIIKKYLNLNNIFYDI
jgi:ribosome-associated toxin RatA of RatAB toxin-antitoxin module